MTAEPRARPTWRGCAAAGIEAALRRAGPRPLRRARSPPSAPLALAVAARPRRPARARPRPAPCRRSSAAWSALPAPRSAAAGSLAAKLAGLPEAEREALVLELVRGEVAAVLGHASAAAIEPERAFKELGFDSLAAVELRNRLAAATGLRLAATLVFDYPTAAAAGRAPARRRRAPSGAAKQVARPRRRRSDEPIAIVGMACRYPGGVASPEELWQLVAEGRDGDRRFPADRGWDLERLYDPDPDNPGTSYAREGGFLADAGRVRRRASSASPRARRWRWTPSSGCCWKPAWEALEDAGIDPASLRGSRPASSPA